jgi:hypothetical protein
MTKSVTYGTDSFRLPDDADLTDLANRVAAAVQGGGDLVAVTDNRGGVHQLLISPGVHITLSDIPASKPMVAFV